MLLSPMAALRASAHVTLEGPPSLLMQFCGSRFSVCCGRGEITQIRAFTCVHLKWSLDATLWFCNLLACGCNALMQQWAKTKWDNASGTWQFQLAFTRWCGTKMWVDWTVAGHFRWLLAHPWHNSLSNRNTTGKTSNIAFILVGHNYSYLSNFWAWLKQCTIKHPCRVFESYKWSRTWLLDWKLPQSGTKVLLSIEH